MLFPVVEIERKVKVRWILPLVVLQHCFCILDARERRENRMPSASDRSSIFTTEHLTFCLLLLTSSPELRLDWRLRELVRFCVSLAFDTQPSIDIRPLLDRVPTDVDRNEP